jgi:hypothetical protein
VTEKEVNMVDICPTRPSGHKDNVSKVHADSSNFAEGVTKEEAYNQVIEQAEALFEGQRNWVGF